MTNDFNDHDIIEMNAEKLPLTAQELSKHPIAVIRINRLYRSGMTPEELYDTTRGWWRVNIEVANKIKYALSVAEDHVKEVYDLEGTWHRYGSNGQDDNKGLGGRYRFEGKVARDKTIRSLYLGRSIEGLFKRGDAYPVRYFGVE